MQVKIMNKYSKWSKEKPFEAGMLSGFSAFSGVPLLSLAGEFAAVYILPICLLGLPVAAVLDTVNRKYLTDLDEKSANTVGNMVGMLSAPALGVGAIVTKRVLGF